MSDNVLSVGPLGFPWQTVDPFLFCAHHDDAYPAGNEDLGPAASLAGRRLGMDFEGIDGWRMYHGEVVPGFPQHPHRGFETISLVRHGRIDHADSLGATARFGSGDVQWMTAGSGIVHAEMFPLLDSEGPNRLELFQIWINLPRAKKMVDPYFSMLWADTIPQVTLTDDNGRAIDLSIVAGVLGDARGPEPPPDSWASNPDSDVAVWTIRMDAGARWTPPPAAPGAHRVLYFFRGVTLTIDGSEIPVTYAAQVRADAAVEVVAGDVECELLMLQGRPIGEPVAHYGPFVMNTAEEIQQAMRDYQRTQFGGWPWPSDAPVHERARGRFAKHADGRVEDAE